MNEARGSRPALWLACAAALLLLGGCQKAQRQKAVHPVRGQVKFQGQGVKDCRVIFYPLDDPEDMERPEAYTDAAGYFEVAARRNEKGAAEGRYKVVLVWRDRNDDPETSDQRWKGPNKLPSKFGSPNTTDLVVEVKPGPNELPPFDLR